MRTTAKYTQLRLDGSEVALGDEFPVVHSTAKLTGVQRAILEFVRVEGSIRSVEAGVIVHLARGRPCYGSSGGIGCCRYAASDGLDACKRLAARGLLRRTVTLGRWEA